ncbi:hypothetical protein KJ603_01280, partial [Patescibacteria group bacterium]|nr:hypothetical protein [Patescibacteria group bacterium]
AKIANIKCPAIIIKAKYPHKECKLKLIFPAINAITVVPDKSQTKATAKITTIHNSIFFLFRSEKIELWMVVIFAVALVCDLSGTTVMALIAGKINFNLHSLCGYFALMIMAGHLILAIFALKQKYKANIIFSRYSIFAWIIWSSAFFTGIPK